MVPKKNNIVLCADLKHMYRNFEGEKYLNHIKAISKWLANNKLVLSFEELSLFYLVEAVYCKKLHGLSVGVPLELDILEY